MSTLDPFALANWITLSADEQRARMQRAMSDGLDRDLDLDAEVVTSGGWLSFLLSHRATGITLQLVPGGTFVRGFSEAEERALREELEAAGDEDAQGALSVLDDIASLARPVATVHVPSFLLSPATLDEATLERLIGAAPDGLLPHSVTVAGAGVVATALRTQGLRLPSEAEHEYTYRAGSLEPFPWGRLRLASPAVPWNPFGFVEMGEISEVCADGFQAGYEEAPLDGSPRDPLAGPPVARGGAAELWPWQGLGEWVAMLSGARSSSVDHDGFLTVRPARTIVMPG